MQALYDTFSCTISVLHKQIYDCNSSANHFKHPNNIDYFSVCPVLHPLLALAQCEEERCSCCSACRLFQSYVKGERILKFCQSSPTRKICNCIVPQTITMHRLTKSVLGRQTYLDRRRPKFWIILKLIFKYYSVTARTMVK